MSCGTDLPTGRYPSGKPYTLHPASATKKVGVTLQVRPDRIYGIKWYLLVMVVDLPPQLCSNALRSGSPAVLHPSGMA